MSSSLENLKHYTDAQIGETVQRHFDDESKKAAYQTLFGDIYFQVDKQAVRRGDGWVRIPVQPSREPRRIHYMYGLLADLSVQIGDELGINLLLDAGDPLEGYPEPIVETPELV
ncbi:MAG: hypothetical protein H7Y38_05500, partial [Armatimonadetes bacterium]|nr:hypothetical protein [Armatimonadota bacterium]